MQLMTQILFKRLTLPIQNQIRSQTQPIFSHTTLFWRNMFFCKNLDRAAMGASISVSTKPIKTFMLSRSSK